MLALALILCVPPLAPPGAAPAAAEAGQADRAALEQTSIGIRAAFARGDVAGIMAYHHPDVVKALAFDRRLTGATEVARDLTGTLAQFRLEFVENHVEDLLILGDTAIEQTRFVIRGTPLAGGESFTFRGRAQITYIRYRQSPSGWATIREIIQPAP